MLCNSRQVPNPAIKILVPKPETRTDLWAWQTGPFFPLVLMEKCSVQRPPTDFGDRQARAACTPVPLLACWYTIARRRMHFVQQVPRYNLVNSRTTIARRCVQRRGAGVSGGWGCMGCGTVRFRGGLVFKAHRLVYHSTLCVRVIKKQKDAARSDISHF